MREILDGLHGDCNSRGVWTGGGPRVNFPRNPAPARNALPGFGSGHTAPMSPGRLAWLALIPALTAGGANLPVQISVDPGSLAPGSYEAKLRFWTWQGANVPTARVLLIVE